MNTSGDRSMQQPVRFGAQRAQPLERERNHLPAVRGVRVVQPVLVSLRLHDRHQRLQVSARHSIIDINNMVTSLTACERCMDSVVRMSSLVRFIAC